MMTTTMMRLPAARSRGRAGRARSVGSRSRPSRRAAGRTAAPVAPSAPQPGRRGVRARRAPRPGRAPPRGSPRRRLPAARQWSDDREPSPAPWWTVRRAANRKPATYRCPICGHHLPALSEHMLIAPEGDSRRRRHAHTDCVLRARATGHWSCATSGCAPSRAPRRCGGDCWAIKIPYSYSLY